MRQLTIDLDAIAHNLATLRDRFAPTDADGTKMAGALGLSEAILRCAILRCANLSEADLRWANLRWANLSEADLRWANLSEASGGVLAIDGLPSGSVRLTPTPGGWALRVGCWGDGTATYGTSALRDLIAGTDWPEAEGEEQDRRRPGLAAVADLCDAHAAANPDLIADLAKRWGTDKAVSS